MCAEKTQTLDRVIALLDCFSAEHPELGVREVARLVNLSSSTAGRLLAAMKENGILTQNPVTREYSMGPKVLTWASTYTSTLDVRAKAQPALRELYLKTLETVSLYILDGNERVCIERLESPRNVRTVVQVGGRLPLYAGSAGKVFLAFLSPQRRQEILSATALTPLTRYTIVDTDSLEKELKKIRKQGYAVSFGEWKLEAAGIGAPIFNINGEVVAAVTISGPSQRFTKASITEHAPEVVRVAAQISRELGYCTI
ncbi:MAG: IclR family transcriptional regulator [Chloroflexi bacterium]|nr:IclR family transcriptional regulator [Anaerolineaceae bacterium]NMB90117.1 IclR family transcriptional regulator [Chloroflexota bacterium]